MKLALSLLVIAPALALAQQASDAGFKPVSLQEAVTMAQQNSPSAVQARGAIENAEGTIETTRMQFFPTLTGSLGHSQGAGSRFDATNQLVPTVSKPQFTTGLNSNLTVFDGGKRVADLRARRADLTAA